MNKFTVEDKIGDIVAKFPGAADTFQKYRIDFCCGGDRKLATAIEEGNLDQEEIISQLNEKYEDSQKTASKDIDWQQSSYTELMDHVVNTHHAYLNENLPKISELVTTILRVHGANHQELSKVHKLFHRLKMELEQHLIKEEEILFPIIKEYENNPSKEQLERTVSVIEEVENEHDDTGDIVKELRSITEDYIVPDDGCNTYRLTYQLLEELESDLFQHIHLENNILFPRLAKDRETIKI